MVKLPKQKLCMVIICKGNPSNLPYICCLFDSPQNRSQLVTPVNAPGFQWWALGKPPKLSSHNGFSPWTPDMVKTCAGWSQKPRYTVSRSLRRVMHTQMFSRIYTPENEHGTHKIFKGLLFWNSFLFSGEDSERNRCPILLTKYFNSRIASLSNLSISWQKSG